MLCSLFTVHNKYTICYWILCRYSLILHCSHVGWLFLLFHPMYGLELSANMCVYDFFFFIFSNILNNKAAKEKRVRTTNRKLFRSPRMWWKFALWMSLKMKKFLKVPLAFRIKSMPKVTLMLKGWMAEKLNFLWIFAKKTAKWKKKFYRRNTALLKFWIFADSHFKFFSRLLEKYRVNVFVFSLEETSCGPVSTCYILQSNNIGTNDWLPKVEKDKCFYSKIVLFSCAPLKIYSWPDVHKYYLESRDEDFLFAFPMNF